MNDSIPHHPRRRRSLAFVVLCVTWILTTCSMNLPSRPRLKALAVRHQSTLSHVTRHDQREMAERTSITARNTIPWTKSPAQCARLALQGHGLLLLSLRPATRMSRNFSLARAPTPMNQVSVPIPLRPGLERRTHEQCATHLAPQPKNKSITVNRTIPRTGRSWDTDIQRSARGAVYLQTSPARKERSRLLLPAQLLCQATKQAMVTAVTAMMMIHLSRTHQRTWPHLPEARQTVPMHTTFTATISIRNLQTTAVYHRCHEMRLLSIELMLSSKVVTSPASDTARGQCPSSLMLAI